MINGVYFSNMEKRKKERKKEIMQSRLF